MLLTAIAATVVIVSWVGDATRDRGTPAPPRPRDTQLAEQPLVGLGGGVTVRELSQDTPFSLVARIVTVNGESFSTDVLRKAVAATKNGPAPIRLEAVNSGTRQTYDLSYQGGERYPHLVRDASKTDYLSAIIRPR